MPAGRLISTLVSLFLASTALFSVAISMGEKGVTKSPNILRNELDLTMAFCGVSDVKKVSQDILMPGSFPVSRTL
jgi:isopentenyl diphosphate isomerase/L-lactate dehydrogenase-like FMN-dependent dehydrogenase